MARSIEWLTEAAIITHLGLASALSGVQMVHADDYNPGDSFSGILVGATQKGIISKGKIGCAKSRIVYGMDITVTLRRLIPNSDAAANDALWKAISDAILSPTLPTGFASWNAWAITVTGLKDLSYFNTMPSAASSRENQDDRTSNVRKFEAQVAEKD